MQKSILRNVNLALVGGSIFYFLPFFLGFGDSISTSCPEHLNLQLMPLIIQWERGYRPGGTVYSDLVQFHQIFFFTFQHFHDHISVDCDEKPSHTIFDINWFMVAGDTVARKFYLINSIVGYEQGQFTLISMKLVRYSCGHIFGSPWTGFHQIWAVDVFIMLHRYMLFKMLKCKFFFFGNATTSVL